jgi:hypothetical protein
MLRALRAGWSLLGLALTCLTCHYAPLLIHAALHPSLCTVLRVYHCRLQLVPGPALIDALLGHMQEELQLYDYDELTQVGYLSLAEVCGWVVWGGGCVG